MINFILLYPFILQDLKIEPITSLVCYTENIPCVIQRKETEFILIILLYPFWGDDFERCSWLTKWLNQFHPDFSFSEPSFIRFILWCENIFKFINKRELPNVKKKKRIYLFLFLIFLQKKRKRMFFTSYEKKHISYLIFKSVELKIYLLKFPALWWNKMVSLVPFRPKENFLEKKMISSYLLENLRFFYKLSPVYFIFRSKNIFFIFSLFFSKIKIMEIWIMFSKFHPLGLKDRKAYISFPSFGKEISFLYNIYYSPEGIAQYFRREEINIQVFSYTNQKIMMLKFYISQMFRNYVFKMYSPRIRDSFKLDLLQTLEFLSNKKKKAMIFQFSIDIEYERFHSTMPKRRNLCDKFIFNKDTQNQELISFLDKTVEKYMYYMQYTEEIYAYQKRERGDTFAFYLSIESDTNLHYFDIKGIEKYIYYFPFFVDENPNNDFNA